ncbi:hypothetical protein COK05_04015 [Bacillus cereus]|uniref:Uncharacterized protein n=1 Tax=Bacillus cereus TaxID=1396 RepID=A0A2C1M0G0_BACCE|nr:hypothetical protein COK05_04015 [Bacillus cereus]PGU10796.1 hypothetical protein COD21_13475 [Bacillus cereus]
MFIYRLITYGITKRLEFNLFFSLRLLEADRIYDNRIKNVESFEKVNRIRLLNVTFSLFLR